MERLVATALASDGPAWLKSPHPGRWSPSEVVEHVVLANKLGARRLATLSPRTADPEVLDLELPYLFYRGEEPTGLAAPQGTFGEVGEACAALQRSVDELLAAAEALGDLRRLGAEHPMFGMLDGVQWLGFYAAHMERHRAELLGMERAAAAG
jgi:hypothetical protein